MNNLIQALLQTLLVALAVPPLLHSQPYQWIIKRLRLNRKPFNCPECLSMYLMLVLQLTIWGTSPILTCLTALATAWLTNETDKIHQKLF